MDTRTAPATLNAQLRDEVLVHLIDLHRYANSEVRAMLRILNAADADLFARLMAALPNMATPFSVSRLTAALIGVWEVNEGAYRQITQRSAAEMRALTEMELDHQRSMFNDLLPEEARTRLVNVEAVHAHAAATAEPFRGRLLSEWFTKLAADRQERIETELRIGFTAGETVDEMIRRLRGTRAEGYADGLLQIDRRHAEAVVRTATSHFAQRARESFYEANSDLITEEQWVSTLDNRTTEMCQIRDGLIYTSPEHRPVGHRVPWLEGPGAIHWNCRSVSIPVVDSAKALGLDLPPVERAAMNGVAAPGTTYREWIEAQPAARQDQILGPTRASRMRSGKLDFPDFFDAKGQFLTLDELRQKNRL